jgi:hypothetical protein
MNDLPSTNTDKHAAEEIEKKSESVWLSVFALQFQTTVNGLTGKDKVRLQGMVDPFSKGNENTSQREQHQGFITDNLDIHCQGHHEQRCAEYEHGLVPIVNDELRKDVSWFHLGLPGVGVCVRGCHKCYTRQVFFARMLTSVRLIGYASPVTKKNVTGFSSPNSTRRTYRPSLFGGFFVSISWLCSFGRAMWGAARLAGPGAGLLTRMVPSFLRLAAQGRENPLLPGVKS